jgi:hypothetical protein
VGRGIDRTVIDLDQAAAVIDRQWFVWTAAGIRVHPIALAGAETGQPRSFRLRVSRHNAQADVVLYADGWVETDVRRPDATATTHATAEVDTVDAFGHFLDRIVELISWSGPGLESKHSPPADTAGPERAAQWVAGYDGVLLPGET